MVDFEIFRPALKRALRRSDRSKAGRPRYDRVLMFKVLVLQALLLDKENTASAVWADTAYRCKANEAFMEKNGFQSQVHHKKQPKKSLPRPLAKANAARSKVRAAVERVFAHQKARMGSSCEPSACRAPA